jgi:hypothetical protein
MHGSCRTRRPISVPCQAASEVPMVMRSKAKQYLANILAALDKPEVSRDVSSSEWRTILQEVKGAVAMRLECLDEEPRCAEREALAKSKT